MNDYFENERPAVSPFDTTYRIRRAQRILGTRETGIWSPIDQAAWEKFQAEGEDYISPVDEIDDRMIQLYNTYMDSSKPHRKKRYFGDIWFGDGPKALDADGFSELSASTETDQIINAEYARRFFDSFDDLTMAAGNIISRKTNDDDLEHCCNLYSYEVNGKRKYFYGHVFDGMHDNVILPYLTDVQTELKQKRREYKKDNFEYHGVIHSHPYSSTGSYEGFSLGDRLTAILSGNMYLRSPTGKEYAINREQAAQDIQNVVNKSLNTSSDKSGLEKSAVLLTELYHFPAMADDYDTTRTFTDYTKNREAADASSFKTFHGAITRFKEKTEKLRDGMKEFKENVIEWSPQSTPSNTPAPDSKDVPLSYYKRYRGVDSPYSNKPSIDIDKRRTKR